MGRHVIRPFHHMLVVRGVLGNHNIEVPFQVATDIRVRILIDSQRRRSVLQE